MNHRTIIVFDFETTSADASRCSPVQLSAIALNPRTLNVIPNSEFNSFMKPHPDDFVDPETVDWHVKIRNNQGGNYTAETLLKEWETYPPQDIVWKSFTDYLLRYHTNAKSKTMFSAGIFAGANILSFDCVIIQRLSERYGNVNKEGKSNIAFPRDRIDIQQLLFYWWENLADVPNSFAVDNLRDFFGMSKEKGHDALQDVKDCAEMIVRCLRLMRNFSSKVKFKGSIANDADRLIQ